MPPSSTRIAVTFEAAAGTALTSSAKIANVWIRLLIASLRFESLLEHELHLALGAATGFAGNHVWVHGTRVLGGGGGRGCGIRWPCAMRAVTAMLGFAIVGRMTLRRPSRRRRGVHARRRLRRAAAIRSDSVAAQHVGGRERRERA